MFSNLTKSPSKEPKVTLILYGEIFAQMPLEMLSPQSAGNEINGSIFKPDDDFSIGTKYHTDPEPRTIHTVNY